jgi:hypothetical protein
VFLVGATLQVRHMRAEPEAPMLEDEETRPT